MKLKHDAEKNFTNNFEDNLSTKSNNKITNILVRELSLTILKIFTEKEAKTKTISKIVFFLIAEKHTGIVVFWQTKEKYLKNLKVTQTNNKN